MSLNNNEIITHKEVIDWLISIGMGHKEAFVLTSVAETLECSIPQAYIKLNSEKFELNFVKEIKDKQ